MPSFALAPELASALKDLPLILSHGRSERTVRAICYRFEAYLKWANDRGLRAVPVEPDILAMFIEVMESRGYKANTIHAYLSAISTAYRTLGFQNPAGHPIVKETVQIMRRRQEGEQRQQALALSESDIKKILSILDQPRRTKFGRMEDRHVAQERASVDAALLLTMTQAALRRGEAQALKWGDIREYGDGSGRIAIPSRRAAKNVPERVVAVTPGCLRTLVAIKPHGACGDKRVFGISATQIARRLKMMCEAASIDPTNIGGDTPRQSLVRIMMENGAPLALIQRQSRWKVSSMPMTYTREADAGVVLKWLFEPP